MEPASMSWTSTHVQQHTNGFHLTLTTHIHDSRVLSNCALHLLYSLGPGLFIDPYELSSRSNLYTLAHHAGIVNLELPTVAVPPGETVVLLNISLPYGNLRGDVHVTIDLPLHLRYGAPHLTGRHLQLEVPWPIAFWTCSTDVRVDDSSCADAPFKLALLFQKPPSTVLLIPRTNSSIGAVEIPVGRIGHLRFVEAGLLLALVASATYLVLVLQRTRKRSGG